MFEERKKQKAKPGPLDRNRDYRQVSGAVLASCYVASAAIAAISVSEAVKCFDAGKTGNGTFYIILAAVGVLFSVFITVLNRRNRKLIAQGKSGRELKRR